MEGCLWALLFCRVTDVPFLPKMNQRTKIGRNSTPGEGQHTKDTHSEADLKSCLVCYMYTRCHMFWRASCGQAYSLVPKPSTPPVFDCLQYAKML